jgi:hypothetical protein
MGFVAIAKVGRRANRVRVVTSRKDDTWDAIEQARRRRDGWRSALTDVTGSDENSGRRGR